jgi:hypothetical protein
MAVWGDVTEVVTVVAVLLVLLERMMGRLEGVMRLLMTVQVAYRQPQSKAQHHSPHDDTAGHRESVCAVAASDHRTNRANWGVLSNFVGLTAAICSFALEIRRKSRRTRQETIMQHEGQSVTQW